MADDRWTVITPWPFKEERDALGEIRRRLGDDRRYRYWSNFAFIADSGRLHHVDLLVASPDSLHLIEFANLTGRLRTADGVWVTALGREITAAASPVTWAQQKARAFSALLGRCAAGAGAAVPPVQGSTLVISEPFDGEFAAAEASLVFGLGDPRLRNLIDDHLRPVGQSAADAPEPAWWRGLPELIAGAGLRATDTFTEVGPWRLGDRPVAQGPDWQDYVAWSMELDKVSRRVRVYPEPGNGPWKRRRGGRNAAEREYQVLRGMNHPGVVRAEGTERHPTGPALVYQVEPTALPLDHYLTGYGDLLDPAGRFAMARQLASAVAYGHRRRLRHGSLSPQTVLVTPRPPQPGQVLEGWLSPRLRVTDWREAVVSPKLGDDVVALGQLIRLVLTGDATVAGPTTRPDALPDSLTPLLRQAATGDQSSAEVLWHQLSSESGAGHRER